jgi:glycosyltransferase involved in cell wall biosynthesis
MGSKFVSIILPCYNEAAHLEKSIRLLLEESENFNFQFEFIFVEDKSSDATRDLLEKFESLLKNAQFVYHSENKGRGAAVKTGFSVAKGDIIGFIDIDLEIGPRYIIQFVEALEENDVAIGNRKYYSNSIGRALIRDTLSSWYRALSKKILQHFYSDTEAGYKFFRREAMSGFFKSPSANHWFWDTEFIMYCFNNKLKVIEIDVDFLRDHGKKSTVKVIKDSIYYLKELLKYKKQQKA